MWTSVRPVVCAGEILMDLIAPAGQTLKTAETFAIREGGAPMNAAIAMARLGLPVSFCGAVGDDPFGTRLRRFVALEGVDTTSLRVIPGETTSVAYAWRDERGDGQFHLVRLADRQLNPTQVEAAGIDHASALLVGSVSVATSPSREAILRAVEIAVANDVPVVFDVNVRPSLWPDLESLREVCEPVLRAATLLKVSLDDAESLWGTNDPAAVVEAADVEAPRMLVMTDGSRGVHLANADGALSHFPVFEVDAVDPTGAGDAFTAALITRLVANEWQQPTVADIRFAMAAGALAATKQGAIAALPTLDDLQQFLRQRGESR